MQKRKDLSHLLGTAMLVLLFGATSVHAQTGMTEERATPGETTGATSGASGAPSAGKALNKADQNMMREIAYANLAEIEAGKLAQSKAKNEQVRDFAQKMIDDHTKAQENLQQLAQAKGVTLPTQPDRKHQAALKKLEALEGEQFDKRYMAQGGVGDHRNTHRLLERTQKRATDPELQALATEMLPVINQHLALAQEVRETTTGASGASGATGSGGTSGTPGATGGDTSGTPGTTGSGGTSGTPGASGSSGAPGVSGTSGSSNSMGPGK